MQMVSIKCSELADRYPIGMREFCHAIGDSVQLAIMTVLIDNEGPMYPAEIAKELRLNSVEDATIKLNRNGIIHLCNHEFDSEGKIVNFRYDIYPIWIKMLQVMGETLDMENANGI